jgi:uncharacterized membrane protein YkvI
MSTHAPVPFLARRAGPFPMPVVVTTILSLVAGGLQVVNQLVLKGHPEWQGIIAVFLIFLVGIGITPATGVAFRNLIHLPVWANTLITAVISAAAGLLQIASIGTTAHVIVATVLTVLAALGFGASAAGGVVASAGHGAPASASHPRR